MAKKSTTITSYIRQPESRRNLVLKPSEAAPKPNGGQNKAQKQAKYKKVAARRKLPRPNPAPAGKPANGQQKNLKKWTIMVYLAGDNNLSEEMIYGLKGMHAAGSTDDVQIVALYDSIGTLVPYDIPPLKPKPVRALGGRGAKNVPPLPFVTEPHKLKEVQEKFLRTREVFQILSDDAANDYDRNGVVTKQGELVADRKKNIVQQNGSIGKAFEKLEKALRKEKEVLRETRAAVRQVNQGAGLKLAKDSSLLRRLRLTGSVSDNLRGFLIDSISRYPAEHYALILSGHGSGAVGDFLTSNKQFISLSMPGLSKTLREVRNRFRNFEKPLKEPWLDILGFDSCLMSMAEVAFEVRDCVRYMVGGEGFQANTGWPYDRIIKLLHEKPNLKPRAFASQIVDEHLNYYNDYTAADLSVDLTAMDLKQLTNVVTALGGNPRRRNGTASGLANLLTAGLEHEQIVDALLLSHWQAQGYKNEQYTDLWDYCECLANRTGNIQIQIASRITRACRRLQDSIEGLVLRSGFRGAAFQHSHGISIFFPWALLKDAAEVSELEHYAQLAFASVTNWDKFLEKYLEKTIRESRRPAGPKTQPQHSFLNCRPGLFTGRPQKESPSYRTPDDGLRAPDDSLRAPDDSLRAPDDSLRAPDDSLRAPDDSLRAPDDSLRAPDDSLRASGTSRLRIASMKNPPITWFKLKSSQT